MTRMEDTTRQDYFDRGSPQSEYRYIYSCSGKNVASVVPQSHIVHVGPDH